ncbi:hypothetical protein K458DRAFT_147327 [Lentithecium fluviatile CBS 122367]|uniref:Uncharacterized protein n=1 Tax=Lentithecium fluviatile CBS 122367 TaxID=1168545 RepID=A0A6G1JCU0_9PLEO|nr:hypothetical protein K458DRAFT_147327 [Lentithecium fluviatile CBS 122367]
MAATAHTHTHTHTHTARLVTLGIDGFGWIGCVCMASHQVLASIAKRSFFSQSERGRWSGVFWNPIPCLVVSIHEYKSESLQNLSAANVNLILDSSELESEENKRVSNRLSTSSHQVRQICGYASCLSYRCSGHRYALGLPRPRPVANRQIKRNTMPLGSHGPSEDAEFTPERQKSKAKSRTQLSVVYA